MLLRQMLDIYDLIEAAMDEHSVVPNPSLEEVLAVGEEARQSVRRYAEKISS